MKSVDNRDVMGNCLYTTKNTKYPKWSKENYFLAIKKLMKEYSIKVDYDIDILLQKSHKELKMMYRELQLQIYATKPREICYGKRNYGNVINYRGKRYIKNS